MFFPSTQAPAARRGHARRSGARRATPLHPADLVAVGLMAADDAERELII
jgi:hypothetical protein